MTAPHYHGFTPAQRATFGALMRAAALHYRAQASLSARGEHHVWDEDFAEKHALNSSATAAGVALYSIRRNAREYARRIRARGRR